MKRYAMYGIKDSIYIMASDLQTALSVYVSQYQSVFGEPVKVEWTPENGE